MWGGGGGEGSDNKWNVPSWFKSNKNYGHLTEYWVPLNCFWRGKPYVFS